jgi:hypothetical protein
MNSIQSKFEAVKIGISLSQQLITASIGLLTVIGGGIVYLIKVDNYNYIAFLPLILSILCLLISIYQGFMGIAVARNNGFHSWWSISAGSTYFKRQTRSCLAGILFFLLTALVIFVAPKKSENPNRNNNLYQIINDSNASLELLISTDAFETGNYKLNDTIKADLIRFISELKVAKAVFIVGSADKRELHGELRKQIGSNFELSSLRAESVKSFLILHGVDSNKVITHVIGGYHSDKMEYSEDRKVQIFIIKKN